jgi:hypothetical protein
MCLPSPTIVSLPKQCKAVELFDFLQFPLRIDLNRLMVIVFASKNVSLRRFFSLILVQSHPL